MIIQTIFKCDSKIFLQMVHKQHRSKGSSQVIEEFKIKLNFLVLVAKPKLGRTSLTTTFFLFFIFIKLLALFNSRTTFNALSHPRLITMLEKKFKELK